MIAGKELDRLVAEKVMGWEEVESDSHGHYWVDDKYELREAAGYLPMSRFSTDIAAAWEVVEAMRKRGFHLLMNDTMGQYRAQFYTLQDTFRWDRIASDGAYYQFADTAPHAICLAALAALSSPPPSVTP